MTPGRPLTTAMMLRQARRRLLAAGMAGASLLHPVADAEEWPGHERLTREQVLAGVAHGSKEAPADLSSKNLSGLDLSAVDFRGANLSATVFNRASLRG